MLKIGKFLQAAPKKTSRQTEKHAEGYFIGASFHELNKYIQNNTQ